MIGRLRGVLIHKAPPWLVLDVHGVGYELEAPMSTIYELPELGREVTLFVHHAIPRASSPFSMSIAAGWKNPGFSSYTRMVPSKSRQIRRTGVLQSRCFSRI